MSLRYPQSSDANAQFAVRAKAYTSEKFIVTPARPELRMTGVRLPSLLSRRRLASLSPDLLARIFENLRLRPRVTLPRYIRYCRKQTRFRSSASGTDVGLKGFKPCPAHPARASSATVGSSPAVTPVGTCVFQSDKRPDRRMHQIRMRSMSDASEIQVSAESRRRCSERKAR